MNAPQQAANLAIERDPRWAAVLARDAQYDGCFVYAVRSTGVYCKPSCKARTPRPENVSFHANCAAAEAAGYRACKRCRPNESQPRHAEAVTAACRLIEAAETPPPLAELAAQVGLSPHHLHRVFKAVTGVTPRDYATALRAERVRARLATGVAVTDAVFDAGYNAGSRFYDEAGQVLGMQPSAYRRGGVGSTIRFAVAQCSLGALLVAQSERGLCAISLGDDAAALVRELQDRFARAELVGGDAQFEQVVAQVVGFVETPRLGLALPLDIRGTAFQQRVWQALREIPPGQTASYSDIAERIGAPSAVRAVAGACAANTLAVAIPCHRVVRLDGDLSGYRWGVARKRALLEREGQP
ncbi:bifunctional DNA-binding transcriptional regulator/O6-methylguanine-DNA methyltransferase Ada [Chitinolyticbacter albus]|uniref:bifunctional DNA-binding transcriptional regulator/O6-methylguanine-DNA methyltransferase Ada n=1 Tax=Chitinolyticbacter albus TaxID=2961951 RepID=UPI00210AB13F|nr:bifunctional DNA-binding transcriptional regulator/O6-methylguanine-DNA methyltransferase Ada [Chitinolyticbacter albus]